MVLATIAENPLTFATAAVVICTTLYFCFCRKSKPKDLKEIAREKTNRFPAFADKSFIVNGVKLAYMDLQSEQPNGQTVLLLHGLMCHSGYWNIGLLEGESMTAALVTAGYRVVAPDLRGFGLSDKPHKVSQYGLNTVDDQLKLVWRCTIYVCTLTPMRKILYIGVCCCSWNTLALKVPCTSWAFLMDPKPPSNSQPCIRTGCAPLCAVPPAGGRTQNSSRTVSTCIACAGLSTYMNN